MKLEVTSQVKQKLEGLVSALKQAIGDDLVSVMVHGSAARGGWHEGSDVDLVVVLRSSSREKLESIANEVQRARYAARIESMVLVEREIARAADVFPVFYDDIKRHHVVVHGSDPFASLAIERHHLRLRIEQELREAQIRLRRAVIDSLGGKGLEGAVGRKVKQVRSPLRALLAMKGRAVDDALDTVLSAAGETFGVETKPLTKIADDPRAAHDALVRLLDKAIEDVDAMEGTP